MKQMNERYVSETKINRIVEQLKKLHDVSIYNEKLNEVYATDEYVDVMNRSRKIIDTLALMMENNIEVKFPSESKNTVRFKKDFDDDSHGCGTIVYNHVIIEKFDHIIPGKEFPMETECHLEISKNGSRYTETIGYERGGKLDGIPLTNSDYEKIITLAKAYIRDFDYIEKVFWNTIQDFLDEIKFK